MERWGAAPQRCAFMCDDDNDLNLAASVGRALVVGLGSVSRAARLLPVLRGGRGWWRC
jgi:3-deoxy-D-manno-octulosonate 8-phosphate phosphatase KdsC-like HAD superfamily phosphatase